MPRLTNLCLDKVLDRYKHLGYTYRLALPPILRNFVSNKYAKTARKFKFDNF